MAQKPKRTTESESVYEEEPIVSVDMDVVQAVATALETLAEEPDGLADTVENPTPVAAVLPAEPAPTPTPLSEEELLKKRIAQLEREVFEMRATLNNITPLVVRGVPQGEVLFYLQSLDQRITVIENYLRMVTSS